MSSRKSDDKQAVDIPEYLVDSKKNIKYERCQFFGKVISILTKFTLIFLCYLNDRLIYSLIVYQSCIIRFDLRIK
jgi:hypothetical protein